MPPNNKSLFTLRGVLVGLIVAGVIGCMGVPSFFGSMSISGSEFCPQLFQSRHFSYMRLPGTKVLLSKTTLTPAASANSKDVLQYLVAGTQTDWQPYTVNQAGRGQELGPKVLVDHLESMDSNGSNRWNVWSAKNPSQAALLWPLVQDAAILELYFCVPEMLRRAGSDIDLTSLERELKLTFVRAAKTKLETLNQTNAAPASSLSLRTKAQSMIAQYADDEDFIALKPVFEP
jgi:hypothetical protein